MENPILLDSKWVDLHNEHIILCVLVQSFCWFKVIAKIIRLSSLRRYWPTKAHSPYSFTCLFFQSLTPAMAAVRLSLRPGRLERWVGSLPAAGSWGGRPTLPIGSVRSYFIRSNPPPGVVERGARPPRAAMGGDLYALDFDGVLCDSCGESSLSAVKVSFPCFFRAWYAWNMQLCVLGWLVLLWQAAKVRWPSLFEQVDAAMEEWIVEQMYTVRLLCSPPITCSCLCTYRVSISKLHLGI
jgi:hypothetical protein